MQGGKKGILPSLPENPGPAFTPSRTFQIKPVEWNLMHWKWVQYLCSLCPLRGPLKGYANSPRAEDKQSPPSKNFERDSLKCTTYRTVFLLPIGEAVSSFNDRRCLTWAVPKKRNSKLPFKSKCHLNFIEMTLKSESLYEMIRGGS